MFIHLRKVTAQTRRTQISRPVPWMQTRWGPHLGTAGLFPRVLGRCQPPPAGRARGAGRGTTPEPPVAMTLLSVSRGQAPGLWSSFPDVGSCFLAGRVGGPAPGPSAALPAVVGHRSATGRASPRRTCLPGPKPCGRRRTSSPAQKR